MYRLLKNSINTSGSFNGDMNGQDVVISGNVEGEITSEDTIIVNQSAKIKGTIEYSSLQVSYGAKLELSDIEEAFKIIAM